MLSTIMGLLWTGWSAVRSSRILQYALIAVAVLLAIFVYGRDKRNQGAREAAAEAMRGVVERMERNRRVHREIRSWPLEKRAERLRDLDR